MSGMVFDGVDTGHIYLPTSATGQRPVAALVRGHGDRDLAAGTVAMAVRALHPDPLAYGTMPLAEMWALQMFAVRMASWIGCVLGIVALALSAFVELRNVSVVDGVAFGTALGLVLSSAAIAAYFPASRAASVNPAQTLRSDP